MTSIAKEENLQDIYTIGISFFICFTLLPYIHDRKVIVRFKKDFVQNKYLLRFFGSSILFRNG